MHIGLNLWMAQHVWWPAGASYAADFAANRYMRSGEAVVPGAAYGLTRASGKYAADSSGSFMLFGPNSPARTDCGLLVEPASSNILTNPVTLQTWATTMASAAPAGGPVLGIFTYPMLVTDTVGNVVARLRHPEEQVVSAGQPYAISYWCRAGSTPNMGVIASGNGGSSRLTVALPGGAVSGVATARGTLELVGLSQHGHNVFRACLLWVPNFSGSCLVAIGPGTGVTGHTVIALGAFMEPGTAFTSPMIGAGVASSRAADMLTLHLPAGTHNLTVTFDDMTTRVIEGAVGDYVLPPLERPLIRTIVAVAT